MMPRRAAARNHARSVCYHGRMHAFGTVAIPLEFVLFGLVLAGVALFHRRSLEIAAAGLVLIATYKLLGPGLDLRAYLAHEALMLVNLVGLLLGFALLARHFTLSGLPHWLPRFLPADWRGGLALLGLVALLSTFLDNIAAAILGGVMARSVYKGRVSVSYLVAIVAAANAGGAGSVIGDTTTTMMWIAGVPALHVADAFVGALVAVLFSGVIAARVQQRHQPISKDSPEHARLDRTRLGIVALIVAGTVAANVVFDLPAAGTWAALLAGGLVRPIPWREARHALKGALFLTALVLAAGLMPVQTLPAPSWPTALGLGLVSAVFDNIPLTALALKQGHYDWGVLAFAVGYGGSLLWFGSSAGVALSNDFPQVRNVRRWLVEGWHVLPAYLLGFAAILVILGWKAD